MGVPHSEGVANHTDPLSCVGHREVSGEALAGESIGQPLSRESRFTRDADAVLGAEGNMDGRDSARSGPIPRGQRPWVVRDPGMCRSSLYGNREISRVTVCACRPVRIGEARSRSR